MMRTLTSNRAVVLEPGAEQISGRGRCAGPFWLGVPCRAAALPLSQVVVGVVAFRTHKHEEAEATLTRDGRWRCPALPVLERPLNTLYEPGRFASKPALPYGHEALEQVAAWLKGNVVERYPSDPA
jgi:hypothetical protein